MMRNLLLFLELGRETRPSPLKSDPLSIASAGASLIGSLLGFQSQSDTNRQQISLAREQMAQQRDENQLNRDFQERMWHEQNEYNTPSAMMQRYEDAGLNPFMVGDNSGVGQAGSVGSPSSVGQGSVPNLQAPKLDLTTPATLALQAESVSANIANQRAQTIQQLWETDQYIRYHFGNEASKEFRASHPEMIAPDDPDSSPFMKQYLRIAVKEDLENSILDSKNWLIDRYGSQAAEMSLRKSDAEIDKIASDIKVNASTIKRVASEIARNFADAYKLQHEGNKFKVDSETAQRIMEHVVSIYLHRSNIIGRMDASDLAKFNSLGLVREWLNSPDGALKMFSNFEEKQYLMPLTILLESLGNLFHVSGNFGSSSSEVTHINQ